MDLGELCDALVDGRLRAGDRERLNAILAGSEEARRFYVRSAGLSSSLHEYAAEILTGEVTPLVRPWGWWAKIAAGIVLGGVSLFLLRPDPDRGTVARVSGMHECLWEGSTVETGESVEPGRVLKLGSGSCELTLDSGARVILEGPGQMQILSAWEVSLERGILNAVVPREAQGFRVANPEMAVVGGGAEFSVVALEPQNAEVFVHRGSVAAGHGEGGMSVLGEQQARRYSRGQTWDVREHEFKLRRLRRTQQLVRNLQPLGGQHWGFEANGAGSDSGTRQGGGLDLGAAVFSRNGVRGQGVRVSQGQSVALEVPWVQGLPEWSCAFWFRHSGSAGVPFGGSLLRVGERFGVEFFGNSRPEQGPLGALTCLSGPGARRQLTGQKNVFDGQWHHVVLEFSLRSAKSNRVQLKQYVDGCLEGGEILRLAGAGRAPEKGWKRLEFSGSAFELDEVWVLDRALMPAEILHVRTAHELPPPGSMAGL
jgi:hypothetical protein